MKKSNFWKPSLASAFVPLAALAGITMVAISCGHPSGAGPASACKGSPGDEFCACLAGSTCNSGFMCATDRNQCVLVVGGGGTTGSGSGGTTGAAGTTGLAGTTGATGSGGTTGTAGTTGTTGIAGTNGTAGTNGAAGTNGGSGTNLIMNGDFSNGMTDWGIPNGSPTNPGVVNGQFCLTLVTNAADVIVGWGDTTTSVAVNQGTNYTLSYQVSSSSALSKFEAHVGQVVSPYAVDYSATNDALGTGLKTFTHTFTVTTSDSQAGLAFVMAATTGTPMVCLDNVSLTAN